MPVSAAPVGALLCQRDSSLRSTTATIVSVTGTKASGTVEVVLSDTVLFPVGGGQPCDFGTIGGFAVTDVVRRGFEPVHLVSATVADLVVGSSVEVVVDWQRRWDHMQQHSGQHLLSAIAEQQYGLNTVAWALGKEKSCVEFDLTNQPVPTDETWASLESKVNSLIRDNLPFTIQTASSHEENGSLPSKLPEDLASGVIRNVRIGNLDNNPCCGTHVSSTSQLQCMKLLNTERIRGKNLRLYFIFGDRVLSTLHASVTRDRVLGNLLCAGPDQFVEKVTGLQNQVKDLTKSNKSYLKEVSDFISLNLASSLSSIAVTPTSTVPILAYHRADGDAEFLTTLSKSASEKCKNCVLIFTTGEVSSGGAALVVGGTETKEADVSTVWKAFQTAMGTKDQMKGGGAKGRFQAKSVGWSQRSAALVNIGAVDVL
ncbi:ThrRS/AlaRS common domain-containing protein [Rhizoclosmatium globosum]|uniref:ThrRS/AlaRS common domain-containing protein n=1 Tax=Rhizoclosmatium globosum TaxID=329046 RepID=A0A1Y2CV96_9FUNG|nr:ThrRS/AlaRS common domain-containing protein [Rhizoclosmatium globosum]|eukprot:ORY50970.1 ThrRS/AlaRS common domain-containing protein [Rhizoclosmatium globosum]